MRVNILVSEMEKAEVTKVRGIAFSVTRCISSGFGIRGVMKFVGMSSVILELKRLWNCFKWDASVVVRMISSFVGSGIFRRCR